MTITLPKITNKQQEILELLYRYRFLNRIQIQQFLGHTDKRRVIAWLKDLREKDYLEWIYSTDFSEKTKPAIYYLSLNGIRYLKTLVWDDDSGSVYQPEELHKRYRERERARSFVDRSILVADCCLALETIDQVISHKAVDTNTAASDTVKRTNTPKISYSYYTEADYLDPDSEYYFLSEHETLRSNLCIVKQKGRTTINYLLEIVDATLPHYRLRSRLKAYVNYLSNSEWEGEEPEPIILLAFPTLYSLIYAKRRVKKLLTDEYDDEIPEDIHIRFTTTEQLQEQGITATIWEEGRKLHGL